VDQASQNARIAENIREYSWHCLHIQPNFETQQAFSYTVGFSESFAAPEVLVFGLSHEKAHALLNECATALRRGHRFIPGVPDDSVLAGDYKVVFRALARENFGEYVGTALRYYGMTPFSAMVMFLPDSEHRFPWDPGYAYIPADEPMRIVD
jgi:hypothetical protein